MKNLAKSIKREPRSNKIVFAISIVVLFAIIGASGNPNKANLHSTPTSSKSAQVQSKPSVVTKTETEVQSIPYGLTTVNDANLAKDTTKITTTGVDGSQTLAYKVTYTNGIQTNKQLVSTTVTTQPVTQVTSIGTYVAPSPTTSTSTSCTPLTNGGNCYEPGEYCRNSDHDASGVAGNGEKIACLDNNGWRWEPS